MLVLRGAAPGAAAGRRVVVTGLVVELAGQRLRVAAVRGEAFYCWESPAEVFGGLDAPRARAAGRAEASG